MDVEPLTPEEGRKRFPVFRFENAAGVLYDRTAGLVAAAQSVQSLIRLIRSRDGDIRENTTVQRVDITRDPIRVETSAEDFETERLIVTAGSLGISLASGSQVARCSGTPDRWIFPA